MHAGRPHGLCSFFLMTGALLLAFALPATQAMAESGSDGRFFPLRTERQFFPLSKQRTATTPGTHHLERPSSQRFMHLDRKKIAVHPLHADYRRQSLSGKQNVLIRQSGGNTSHNRAKIRHYWPVEESAPQWVSSPFGSRSDPFTGRQAFHAGLDIAAAEGTPVLASAQGIVEATGIDKRLGRFAKIRHTGNSYSLYGHLSEVHVQKGQRVRARQRIGAVGNSGRSTGPHLDYSLRVNGTPIDPTTVLPSPPAQKTLEISSAK